MERKEIILGWSGFAGRSQVTVMGKSRKKKLRGFITKDCAGWLVVVLRKGVSNIGNQESGRSARGGTTTWALSRRSGVQT